MTTRGMKEKEMVTIANVIDRVTKLAVLVQSNLKAPDNKLKDFLHEITTNTDHQKEIERIKLEVERLTSDFPLPGIDPTSF